MKTAVELYEMEERSFQNEEDCGIYDQFRDNDYDQSTLREFATVSKWNFMEDFWTLIADRNIYSKEFIIEMFGNCDKQTREQIDRLIHDQLSCLWDQLDPKETTYEYMKKIMQYKPYIINAGYFLKYCKNEFEYAASLYQFVEENLNSCIDDILTDYDDIQFIYRKKFYE